MITTRITDPEKIDFELIDKELKENKRVIVQFSFNSYNSKILSQLNELCSIYDINFGVRFYGHHSGSFNFNTLLKIPDVKCLYVDYLSRAENVTALTKLNNLKKLWLGVYELKEIEILKADNLKALTELALLDTKSKAFNLEYLRDYKNLKYLLVASHTKNIEAIGDLSILESLSLNSIKKAGVSFINNLKKLKNLSFILGGRENIHEINENEIENLEITWVRGFNDISNIGNFKKLRSLILRDNIQIHNIHFNQKMPLLNDLRILNCKTFNSITGFENLTSLQLLRISRTGIIFENFTDQKLPETLKEFAFFTGKNRIDDQIKIMLEKRGYDAS